ncbi:MAG: hypothetical protein ACI4GB_04980 [Acutalibacteraceae bacterium]
MFSGLKQYIRLKIQESAGADRSLLTPEQKRRYQQIVMPQDRVNTPDLTDWELNGSWEILGLPRIAENTAQKLFARAVFWFI